MKLSDFHYQLPNELIAQHPPEQHGNSRLLCIDRQAGCWSHQHFSSLPTQLQKNDFLVFNNTKVMRARLFGHKSTGGRVELLVERIVDTQYFYAQVKASKAPQLGSQLFIVDSHGRTLDQLNIEQQVGRFFHLRSTQLSVTQLLAQAGHMPLPPYIKRPDQATDEARYQSIFAEQLGAVAAPTASLHVTEGLLATLKQHGIDWGFLTLHIGAGTFLPVQQENLHHHRMHAEYADVSADLCQRIAAAQAQGGRVIAVGTTCARALESAAQSGRLQPFQGDTELFITPGFQFQVINGLITNFHLPGSTLLMLVAALAGHSLMMRAYHAAIAAEYRFYSYGDAMLII